MREWEYHQHRLHHRDSAQFLKLTPRTGRPADESFGDAYPVLALAAIITLACILAVIGVLYFAVT